MFINQLQIKYIVFCCKQYRISKCQICIKPCSYSYCCIQTPPDRLHGQRIILGKVIHKPNPLLQILFVTRLLICYYKFIQKVDTRHASMSPFNCIIGITTLSRIKQPVEMFSHIYLPLYIRPFDVYIITNIMHTNTVSRYICFV